MAASTPWITGLSMVGWAAANGTVLYFPVNDGVPYNPLSLGTAPGRRFAGYYQRMQNRYTASGTGAMAVNIDVTGQSASAAGWYGGPLMEACGFDISGTTGKTYTLASPNVGDGNVVAVDMGVWMQDGRLQTIYDCVGGMTLNIAGGEIPNMTFNMFGVFDPVGAATGQAQPALQAVPYGQAVCNCSFSIETVSYVLRSFTLSTNPVIAMRKSVAGTGGYAAPAITGYEVTAIAQVEIDNSTVATQAGFEALFRSSVADTVLEVALNSLAGAGVGTVAEGNAIRIDADMILDGDPQRVDDGEGIAVWNIPLILDPSAISATADSSDGLKIAWS